MKKVLSKAFHVVGWGLLGAMIAEAALQGDTFYIVTTIIVAIAFALESVFEMI